MPPPNDSIPPISEDSLARLIYLFDDSVRKANLNWYDASRSNDNNGGTSEGLISMFIFVGVILLIGWVYNNFAVKKRLIYLRHRNQSSQVYNILTEGFPFFNTLDSATQEKFVQRTIVFVNCKEFIFKRRYANEYQVACLISACAVQLTLGLKNYLLAHFKKIYVFEDSYKHVSSDILFQGHVQHGEIHLSWRDFKEGIHNTTDMQNVGLHEMAHAITYECFYAGGKGDEHFRTSFSRYSAVARPIFEQLRLHHADFLGSYGAVNYDEFWAISVEAFFEQPQLLWDTYPKLYHVMSMLLKQDVLAYNR